MSMNKISLYTRNIYNLVSKKSIIQYAMESRAINKILKKLLEMIHLFITIKY